MGAQLEDLDSAVAGGVGPRGAHEAARRRFDRLERATDMPMALLALLVVPALVLEDRAQTSGLRLIAESINWVVWLAFCAEYLGKLAFAPSRSRFVRPAWFDLIIIVLSPPFLVPSLAQGTRAVRALRALRLLRAGAVAAIGIKEAGQALRQRRFHYVLFTTVVVVSLGAVGIFAVEHNDNKAIATLGDAFWWAIVTATTVGYGDVSPVTAEGRMIAVVLMLLGIGFIGVLTATITSFFLEPADTTAQRNALEARLTRIEAKLDALLRDRQG